MTIGCVSHVAVLGHLPFDHFRLHRFPLRHPSEGGEPVDEHFRNVPLHRVLRRSIILRECVMVVVASFANGGDGRPSGFRWRDAHVIGFVSEAMGGRVDEPRRVKRPAVPEEACRVESDEWGFSPAPNGHERRHNEATQKNQQEVVFSLESENGVAEQVREVQFRSLRLDLRVLSHQQPSHMREEEAAINVMRIGISVGPFVMASVISCPFNDVILESHALKEHEQDSGGQLGFIAFVGPKPMGSGGDTETTEHPTSESPEESCPFGLEQELIGS